jgi:hypothetical protein
MVLQPLCVLVGSPLCFCSSPRPKPVECVCIHSMRSLRNLPNLCLWPNSTLSFKFNSDVNERVSTPTTRLLLQLTTSANFAIQVGRVARFMTPICPAHIQVHANEWSHQACNFCPMGFVSSTSLPVTSVTAQRPRNACRVAQPSHTRAYTHDMSHSKLNLMRTLRATKRRQNDQLGHSLTVRFGYRWLHSTTQRTAVAESCDSEHLYYQLVMSPGYWRQRVQVADLLQTLVQAAAACLHLGGLAPAP